MRSSGPSFRSLHSWRAQRARLRQGSQPREVVGRHGERQKLVNFVQPLDHDLPHRPDELAPAEALLDALSLALADLVARVAGGAPIDGAAAAAVSAGNTGALMAIARYLLKTLDGIDRPAIATQLPNAQGGATTVLDLGANVDCSAEHLLQFAVMGSALVSALQEGGEPTVGLLNIGEEIIKGSEVIKKAGELLRTAAGSGDLSFYGNVEGNDIFKGTVDIVVCDGFVGNVALKASEGVASMVIGGLKNEFSRNILTKAAAIIAYPVLKALMKRMDYRRYNGAALLGLRGLVFKSHGSADVLAFEQALNRAYDAARNNLLDRVRTRIAHAAPLLAPADAQAKTGVSATTH